MALVEQPYRVAGRRAPAPAAQLDTAWLAVVDRVRPAPGLPLLFGGRSSGARVACRTATAGGAAGVLCLAFPVHPPGRPEKDRLAELAAPDRARAGRAGRARPVRPPEPAPGRAVVLLRGDHSLKSDAPGLARRRARAGLPLVRRPRRARMGQSADRRHLRPGRGARGRGGQLDLQAPAARAAEHRRRSSALASSTVGSRLRWPSGEMPPAT